MSENHKITMTVLEAVSYTGLSRSFLHKIMADGQLKRLKAGKRVLILKTDLEDYLSSIREGA